MQGDADPIVLLREPCFADRSKDESIAERILRDRGRQLSPGRAV
jgi:hypothetical protein